MLDSIRLRLTLWYLGVLAAIIIAFAAVTYFLVVNDLQKQTDANLSEMAQNFQANLEYELEGVKDKSEIEVEIISAVGEASFHNFIFVVTRSDGFLVGATEPDMIGAAAISNKKFDGTFDTVKTDSQKFRVIRQNIKFGAENYELRIARDLSEDEHFLRRLRSIFLFAVPLSLILTALSGYFLARKSLAPVALMSAQAANIGATNLHERLPVKNERDELGGLASTFNELLTRLETSFEQQRRFMADASHELRTPLAIVRGESEIALNKENRPNAELRESLAIVNDESKRLTRIVEDLFTLARADAGQLQMRESKIYLDELVAECARAVQILAEKRKIKIEIGAAEEMPMRGDEQLLRRLFINLLDNAIKYNRDGGKVSVRAEIRNNCYSIEIEDTGNGIPEEERTKIFERFYRADKARSRSQETATSGAGLGLSIAQWIAGLHGGSIKIVSSNEQGSVFAVELPITK